MSYYNHNHTPVRKL